MNGTVPLDEVVTFDEITCASSGAATDADSTPAFDVFEDVTDTAILSAQSFVKRTSLTGNYRGTFTASAANGFEVGKWYNVVSSATVGGIAGKKKSMTFMLVPAETSAGVPKVDVSLWKGTTAAAVDTAGYPVVTVKDGIGQGELNLTSGVVDANLVSTLGTAVTNEDFTLASATSTTVTLPATASSGSAIPDSSQYASCVLQVVGGTGVGQVVLLTTATGTARQYNVLSGTMPTQPDNTSKCVVLGAWRSNLETIKTNPVVNAGTVTFPTNATLASTTNITAGTITTVTTVTNQLTAAQIATGVWQDATAGDFTVASSIGKCLYVANVVPGAAGGHFIAGTNAATTVTTAFTTTFTGNLTGSVGSVTGAVGSVTGAVGSVAGNVGGNVTGSVGSVTAAVTLPSIPTNWITAAGIADGAIDRATFAADTGLQTIRSGTATGGTSTSITLDGSASSTNNFYNNCLVATTGGTGAGQVRRARSYVGSSKVLTVAPAWTTTPDTSTTFAVLSSDSVWDAVMGDHTTSLTTGASLNAASSAGDPWTTVLPGAYGPNTAGSIIGNNLDALISSRLAPTVAGRTLDVSAGGEAGLDWANIGTPGATVGLTATTLSAVTTTATATNVTTVQGIATNAITAASFATDAGSEIAAAVWDLATVGHTTSGTFGASMNAAGSAGDPWATALPGSYGSGTAGYAVGTNLNATVGSRSTYAGGDTSGTTTLLSRLTSGRAGYLDNLSAGAVALASGVAVSDKTGFSLSTAGAQAVADATLGRSVANVEASAAEWSLCTIILATLESSVTAGTWTITRTNGTTTYLTKTVTTDPAAEPITGIS